MNVKKLLGMFFALLLLAGVVSAQTFYVNNQTGNDANPGTQAQPKLTVASALLAAPTGSTISVAYTGITYTEGNIAITTTPLTFTSTGGTPVFSNASLTVSAATTFTGPFQFVNLTLTSGAVTGASNLTFSGTVTRTAGTVDSQINYTAGAHNFTYNLNTATTVTTGYELPAGSDLTHLGNLTTTGTTPLKLNESKTMNGVLTTSDALNLNTFTLTISGANAHTIGADVTNGTVAFTLTGAATVAGAFKLPVVTVNDDGASAFTLGLTAPTQTGNITTNGTSVVTVTAATTVGNVTANNGSVLTLTAATTVGSITNNSTGNITLNAAGATGTGSMSNTSSGAIDYNGGALTLTGSISQSGTGAVDLSGATGAVSVSSTVTNNPSLTVVVAAKTAASNYGVIIFPAQIVTITGKVTNSPTFTGTMLSSSPASTTHANIGEIRFTGTTQLLTLTGGMEVASSTTAAGITAHTLTLNNSGSILIASTTGNLVGGAITSSSNFSNDGAATTNTNDGQINFTGRTTGTIGTSTTVRVGAITNNSVNAGVTGCGDINFNATATGAVFGTSVTQGAFGKGGLIVFGNHGVDFSGNITSARTLAGGDIVFTGGAGTITYTVGGYVSNTGAAAITFDLTGNDVFTLTGKVENTGTGSITFPNAGTGIITFGGINISAGTITVPVAHAAAINITGAWTVSGGTLNLRGAGAGTAINVSQTLHPDATWTAGTIDFTGRTAVNIASVNFTIGGATTNPTFIDTACPINFIEPVPNVIQNVYVGSNNPVFLAPVNFSNSGNIPAPVMRVVPSNSAVSIANLYVLNNVTFNTAAINNAISIDKVAFNVGKNGVGGGNGDFTNTTGYTTANGGYVQMSGLSALQTVNAGAGATFGNFGVDNWSGLTPAVTFGSACTFTGDFYLAHGQANNVNVTFNGSSPFPTIYRTEGSFAGTPTFTSMVNVVYYGNDKNSSFELPNPAVNDKLNNLTIATTNGAKNGYGIITLTGNGTVNGLLTINANQTLYTAANTLKLAGATVNIAGYLVDDGTTRVQLAAATGTTITGAGSLPSLQVNAGSAGNVVTVAGLISNAFGADGVWNGVGGNADDFATFDGNITYAGGAASSLTLSVTGTAPQFNNLTTAAGATFTLGSNAGMSGNITHAAGTIALGDYTLSVAGGTPNFTKDALTTSTANGLLLFTADAGVAWTSTTGTVVVDANFKYSADGGTMTLSNLTNDLTFTGNFELANKSAAAGAATFDIGAGRTLLLQGANATVGTGCAFTAVTGGTTGILKLDRTGTGGTLTLTVPASSSVVNLTVADNVTLAGGITGSTFTVTTTMNHTDGLLTFGTANLQIGNATAATFTRSAATATYSGSGYLIWKSTNTNGFNHSNAVAVGAMTINKLKVQTNLTLQVERNLNVVNELYLDGANFINQVTGGTTGLGYLFLGDATNVPLVTVVPTGDVTLNALQFNNTNADFTFSGAASDAVTATVWPATATLARNVIVDIGVGNILTMLARTINNSLTLTSGTMQWDTPTAVTMASGATLTRNAGGALDWDASASGATGTFVAPVLNLVYTGAVGNSGIEYSQPTSVNNLTLGTAAGVNTVTLNTARTIDGTVSLFASSVLTLGGNTTFGAAQTLTTGTINTGAFTLTVTGATTLPAVTGNVTANGALTLRGAHTAGTINAMGDVTIGTGASFAGTSNLVFAGTFASANGNQNLTVATAGSTINNITFNQTGTTPTVTLLGGNLTVGGLVTFVNGVLVTGTKTLTITHGLYAAVTPQGFTRTGVTGTNVSHVFGNVAKTTTNTGGVGYAGSSYPRVEFPVGTLTLYRPFTVTFGLDLGGVPTIPNGITYTVSYNATTPGGQQALPIVGGVKTGTDIARYPGFYWYVMTSPSSVSPSIRFDLELGASGFTQFGTNAYDARIIRRHGAAADMNNPWLLQGQETGVDITTKYDNEYNISTGRFNVIVRNSLAGLRADGAVFTLGLSTNLATDVTPTNATAKVATVRGVLTPAYNVNYVLNLEATGAKMFKNNVGTLRYAVTSSNTTLATAGVAGTILTVTPVAVGTTNITVTAYDDANNDFMSYTFPVNVGTVGNEKQESAIPTEFAMSQNYPNPFNPTTAIKFAMPKESHVTIKVVNMLGQEVTTLVDEVRAAGYHVVNFNANGLASGHYVAIIKAGEFTKTIKMSLLK